MKWRLIIDGPVEGAMNMAIDRAVLHSHASGEGPATLRLYSWRVPTVTLGRFQKVDDIDAGFCDSEGMDVARRPTGGRGVLHDDELTYSVVAGLKEGLPRGVAASYRTLCGALVEAYRTLGVEAQLTSRARGDRAAGACYLHATNADLSLGAAKLSGSAQVWDGESCLQHGSFVRSRDVEREARVFRLEPEAAMELAKRTMTFADVLEEPPGDPDITRAVVLAFETTFGIEFETGVLTAEERAFADSAIDRFRVENEVGEVGDKH